MIGLYRLNANGSYVDVATQSGVGLASKDKLGFGCVFLDADLDGALDLAVVNGHIDDTVRNVNGVGYAQPPQLFLNNGKGSFVDVAAAVGGGFSQPKVGRGLAYGDFDRDGDLDLLITTNNGPAYLYRTDLTAGNRGIRFRLVGTKSNRDAIGAVVKIFHSASAFNGSTSQSRLGQRRFELSFAIGTACHLWPGQARQDRARSDRMAERQNRRIQGSRSGSRLRMFRRKRNHRATGLLAP